MPSRFDPLRERLLRAGIAPRRIDRYLGELADHLADLTAEEQCAGPAPGAAARAFARLGSPDSLAAAMIARRELRCWSARWPWAAYLLAPSLALALGLTLSVVILVAAVEPFRPGSGGAPLLPAWFPGFATVLIVGMPLALPILLGWALAAHAARRRMTEYWPMLGMAALGILGGAIGFDLALPSPAGPGEIGVDLALLPPFDHLGAAAARMTANLVLTLVPYLTIRQRAVLPELPS